MTPDPVTTEAGLDSRQSAIVSSENLAARAGVPSGTDRRIAQAVMAEVQRDLELPEGAPGLTDTPREEWRFVNDARLSEDRLLACYTRATGLQTVEEELLTDLEQFPDVTFDYLSTWPAIPLQWDASQTVLAVAMPYGLGQLAAHWYAAFRRQAVFVLARRTTIERMLSVVYDTGAGEEDEALAGWDGSENEETLKDLAREAPIVRLVNDVFSRAVEMQASDIHVEPAEDELAIRYRVDGVLQTAMTPQRNLYPAIASRLKLLAGLNIAEHRLPQDGRIDLDVGRTQLDIRVSTVPTMHGESIVLRLLQKDMSLFEFSALGLPDATSKSFERLVNLPHGMILVVGPTGSGKTTTLYCVMRTLNSDARKIITIEDPVEYQLQGLTQIQVRPQIGLSFANGLRSIVRQDPDVILVGEIRDRETAEIAIHAALTGHLVLSTLHTNDAAGAISRLLEMGVESFLISSSLLCVLSQRLVRRLCNDCSGTGAGGRAEDGRGKCRTCQGRGYRGRIGIYELLVVDDDLRHAINEHRDSTEIAALAKAGGMKTLREDGATKVREGITTEAEVARVCQMDLIE